MSTIQKRQKLKQIIKLRLLNRGRGLKAQRLFVAVSS
jgi:hypothetical protein